MHYRRAKKNGSSGYNSWLAWLLGLAAVAGALYFTFLLITGYQDYRKLRAAKSVQGISVAEAPKYPDVAVFYFEDGHTLPHLAGRVSYATLGEGVLDSGTNHITVVPVVPQNWQLGDPVPLWAGCQSASYFPYSEADDSCTEGYEELYRAGHIISYNVHYYRRAVRDAERTHGLASVPEAPIIRWTEAPGRSRLEELQITSRFYLVKLFLASFACILLAIFLDILAVRGLPRRQPTPHELRLE